MIGFGIAENLNMFGRQFAFLNFFLYICIRTYFHVKKMKDYNLDKALEIYKRTGSLHKTAKEMGTSHISLSHFFRDNGVPINNIGKRRDISDEEFESIVEDYTVNMLSMEKLSEKYHVRVRKLRTMFREKGIKISKWRDHVKKEVCRKPKREPKEAVALPDDAYRTCPYCGWRTTDKENKHGLYFKHLKNEHHVNFIEHERLHPEDMKGLERYSGKIQCKVCGKYLSLIDDRHLQKHGMTKAEYIEKYGSDDIVSPSTKKKLQLNMEMMMSNPDWERQTSNYEREIADFLNENGIPFIQHDRQVLEGNELDFLIGNIAIEFNGNKFHTEWFGGRKRGYHISKTLRCNEKGIGLIQIFEDEFVQHKEIVFKKLLHILGINRQSEKISGRKCSVHEINAFDAEQFLESNHIQGFARSTVYLGAYYSDRLVAVMTFLDEGNGKWNLNRFASDINSVCQGIGGKLFKHFTRQYSPKEVKSFADRRWTLSADNNLYTNLGFRLSEVLPPDYRYYNNKVNKLERFHKFNFRKKALHKKYGLPYNMTETEMVKQIGYDRIWDCGLFKYVWENEQQPTIS